MEQIKLFLIEVTQELLYNIVYDEDEINYLELSEEFENKTGFRPMDFFGFGNITSGGWFNFIRGIPGVQGENIISIKDYSDDSDEESYSDESEDEAVYKSFNTTHLQQDLTGFYMTTVAKYREVILIKCCEILKDQFVDKNCGKDKHGNTPLHLVAALPGLTYDCETLVKYLLEAGVDPLATNDNGKTFLHIILGRFKAENDDDALVFEGKRLHKTKWFVEDRIDLLELISRRLLPTYTSLLAKAQDSNGNTVLHEYACSTIGGEEFVDKHVCKKLLQLGASFRITNNIGDVPLHYASTPKLFKIFVKNGAVCRSRNDRDETPVLSLVKRSADLAFAGTTTAKELEERGFVQTVESRSIHLAVTLLGNVKDIISQNKDAKETVWIPDERGNVAIDIILIAIRIGSYDLGRFSGCNTDLLQSLLNLLTETLRNATPHDMNRTNKKGQNFLHVLLDTDNNNTHKITEKRFILQSIQILRNHGVNVNAVDLQGCTPLDIIYKHCIKWPSFYEKCTELLIENGATGQGYERKTISSLGQPSSLLSKMSNLRVRNETRKVRSCPKPHSSKAKRLADSKTDVTVVKKYRYSDQDLIGTGAFSSVFVAIKDENVDSTSGIIECRAYALKRMEKAKLNPKEIKREITTLLSLSHKCDNIIKCHEPVEDNNFQYICLDLMDGDLHEFVTNDGANEDFKRNPALQVQVTKGIINGLAFLHEQKFIHRDLKPGNILYTTDPKLQFKITDFGLTKNTSSLSMSSTAASGVAMAPGTRCWMAPELVSLKQKEHTEQSDVFSLGLVLHYLFTLGKHPFVNENEEPAHVIERKIAEKPPNIDRKLSPEATSLLLSLLPKVPSTRPPAEYLNQHPYLWSDRKKIEFIKAVGDQPEAEKPAEHPNSDLEERLQTTETGQAIRSISWDQHFGKLYEEMTAAWKRKKYRTDKVIDLIRFIRNAYVHKQDRSSNTRHFLEENIFFVVYQSLVLDVFGVVQKLGIEEHSSIRDALTLDT